MKTMFSTKIGELRSIFKGFYDRDYSAYFTTSVNASVSDSTLYQYILGGN